MGPSFPSASNHEFLKAWSLGPGEANAEMQWQEYEVNNIKCVCCVRSFRPLKLR